MKNQTLVFLQRDNELLLAMKKRGFGAGNWNGVGGKLEPGESVEDAAIRECQEEIEVTPKDLEKVAEIIFFLGDEKLLVNVYLCTTFEGDPKETEEMAPKWFEIDKLPYEKMWDDDKYWLPKVLAGEKLKAEFKFDEDNIVSEYHINEVKPF